MHDLFRRIAGKTSHLVGSSTAFIVAVSLVFVWLLSGPVFGFSNTWQLMINTTTTILTFLMVILLQNTQNRETKAINLKLDELIKSDSGARDSLMDVEDLADEEIEKFQMEFRRLHDKYQSALQKRRELRNRRKVDSPVHFVQSHDKK